MNNSGIPPDLWKELENRATDELRRVNGQIACLFALGREPTEEFAGKWNLNPKTVKSCHHPFRSPTADQYALGWQKAKGAVDSLKKLPGLGN